MLTLAFSPCFDELLISLAKLEALLRIASITDLTDVEPQTALNYFWAASHVLSQTKEICNELAKIEIC